MKDQTAHLCQVLKQATRALGLSLREVERRLGLSRGYFTRLFAGEIDLKIDHVADIAGALDVDPDEFFRLAFPPSQTAPTPKMARLREALGVSVPAAQPAAVSGLEREIEKIVIRKLAKLFPAAQ